MEKIVERTLGPAPVPFEELLDRIGMASGHWEESARLDPQLEQRTATIETTLLQRGSLQELWREILELQPAQRASLLLSMRDESGHSALTLLPGVGVATVSEIGAALEIPAEALAQLWPRLPLDDLRIGELLGVDRKRVIGLRRFARERLKRRSEKLQLA
jgi:hypothetical protein